MEKERLLIQFLISLIESNFKFSENLQDQNTLPRGPHSSFAFGPDNEYASIPRCPHFAVFFNLEQFQSISWPCMSVASNC